MTAPLTPPDCDLRGMDFMALDVTRLRDSDLALLSTGEEFKAAVLLWCAAWLQIPAASLPDDDIRLAKLAGLDPKTWRKVKAGALRGWMLCTDGRLYHKVVAEKALEAWDRRGEWEDKQENKTSRQQRWRDRCKALAQQLRDAGQTPPAGASLAALEEMVARLPPVDGNPSTAASTPASHVDAPEMPLTGTGTGTSTVPNGTSAEAAPVEHLDEKTAVWRAGLKLLMDRGGYPEARARPLVGKWLKALEPADLLPLVEQAFEVGTLDPVSYVTAAIERHKAEEADDGLRTPSEVRQRAWMAEWRESPNSWRPERGPRPGEAGCRVSESILREHGMEPAMQGRAA